MSIRQAIRSRFKSIERGGERGERDTESPTKKGDVAGHPDRPHSLTQQTPGKEASTASSPLNSPSDPTVPLITHDNEESFALNRSTYELQLNQLQEQLVAAMIENQGMADELEDYKSRHKVKELERNLEFERHRVDDLAKKLEEAQAKQQEQEWVDVGQEAQEYNHVTPSSSSSPSSPTPRTWRKQINGWFLGVFYELVQDFSTEPMKEDKVEEEEDQLAVKILKENIKRFKSGSKPIYTAVKGVRSVLHWKYPAFTLLAFLVYMYSAWHGWLLSVFLFLCIFRLFINYLRHKGINVNIQYFADYEEEDKSKETSAELGMGDKFNLVLLVARKVQNTLGEIADSLEKLKNLFTWKQPEATCRLFLALCAAFIASVLLPGEQQFFLFSLYMGIKWFLIEYIYYRFPRIKAKHDSVYQIWLSLPTDVQMERRSHQQAINRVTLPSTEDADMLAAQGGERTGTSGASGRATDDDAAFCQTFDLPITELPLPGWEGGRRCTLVNKDKPLTSAFKHGKLYLTNSFLCFERYKTQSPKNLMIPLTDITNVVKAKPYSWMPGGGMSIEVTVQGFDRPHIFGALLSRDEAMDSIMKHGIKADLTWAKRKPSVSKSMSECMAAEREEKEKEADSLSVASQSSSPRASPGRGRKAEGLGHEDEVIVEKHADHFKRTVAPDEKKGK